VNLVQSEEWLLAISRIEKYKVQTNRRSETNKIIEAHGNFLDSLSKQGILIFAGRTLLKPGLFYCIKTRSKNFFA